MRVVLISDTHAPRYWKSCPPAVARHLEGADAILHAGDVCTAAALDELNRFAPVHAVLGNNDGADVAAWMSRPAPERLELELAGVQIGMIHDSGPKTGRIARLRRAFPAADLVVFGHSHIPWDESSESGRSLRIVNPGSPTDRRRQPHGTIALVDLADGRIGGVDIVPVT